MKEFKINSVIRTMSEFGHPFLKKNRQKTKSMSKRRMCKNRKREMENCLKQKTRPRINNKWIGKTIEKIQTKNRRKLTKIKLKLPNVSRKPLARKQIFVQTPFSHTTLNLEKKFTAQNNSLSFHFLFRRDQNHYSNLTSKIMNSLNRSLKKDSDPIQFNFFELLKK